MVANGIGENCYLFKPTATRTEPYNALDSGSWLCRDRRDQTQTLHRNEIKSFWSGMFSVHGRRSAAPALLFRIVLKAGTNQGHHLALVFF